MYEGDLRAGALGAGTRSEEEEEEEEEEGEERVAVKGAFLELTLLVRLSVVGPTSSRLVVLFLS